RAAVATERNRSHRPVPCQASGLREDWPERSNQSAGVAIPDDGSSVAATGREGRAVGREGERCGPPRGALQTVRDRTVRGITKLDQAIGAAAGERRSVGREGDRENLSWVIGNGPDTIPALGIPGLDDALAIGSCAAGGSVLVAGRQGYCHELIARIA